MLQTEKYIQQQDFQTLAFPSSIGAIKQEIYSIDPSEYGRTRNFGNGAVTKLSPYISRGVISTRQVYEHIQNMGIPWEEAEKLVQELAWRDYWQQKWVANEEVIESNLNKPLEKVSSHLIPTAILEANTGIRVVDEAIMELYETGYMHNHMRMYVASICCNIAQCHWSKPAKWMYAHLLDGDLASNNLSWQWISGRNSKKKYYANQDNINKYFGSLQKDTFLDVSYEEIENMPIPSVLKGVSKFQVDDLSIEIENDDLNPYRETLIYNYYNLDPEWHQNEDVQRVLLLEPSHFEKHKISQKCFDFALELSRNIKDLKVFYGEFEDLAEIMITDRIVFKEHPLNKHYHGKEEARDWLSSVTGDFPSFFAFWKRCKKELNWEKRS